MSKFVQIAPSELLLNPFTTLDKDWMLITAGNKKSFNTMTASWGALGVIWNKYTVTCYIRPQRYTHEFVEREEYFTCSFLESSYRQALALCGRVSGRDTNKVKDADLTPIFDEKAPYFAEANQVFLCRKLYTQVIDPKGFKLPDIDENYAAKDYHTIVIGEIVKALGKK
ncbi:MAG: flavin reductase family protein [Oscillospiraceae bacterium]|nr:flavin reductase family protein [Oscillospiraceae bacterium]